METIWDPDGPSLCGIFTGGQLWTERKDGRMDPSVKGEAFATEGKWHQFDGTRWNGVTPVEGYR
eukprot:12924173-Prorocentrum_lima.AAC.1